MRQRKQNIWILFSQIFTYIFPKIHLIRHFMWPEKKIFKMFIFYLKNLTKHIQAPVSKLPVDFDRSDCTNNKHLKHTQKKFISLCDEMFCISFKYYNARTYHHFQKATDHTRCMYMRSQNYHLFTCKGSLRNKLRRDKVGYYL